MQESQHLGVRVWVLQVWGHKNSGSLPLCWRRDAASSKRVQAFWNLIGPADWCNISSIAGIVLNCQGDESTKLKDWDSPSTSQLSWNLGNDQKVANSCSWNDSMVAGFILRERVRAQMTGGIVWSRAAAPAYRKKTINAILLLTPWIKVYTSIRFYLFILNDQFLPLLTTSQSAERKH